jgi:transcription antitermination factor NusG
MSGDYQSMTAQRTAAPVTDEREACPLLARSAQSSWFAVWVFAHAEFVVEEALIGYGIETFLPTWAETTQWSDRKKTIIRPLFPGYLFVRCADSADGRREPRREILRVAGVIEVLPTNLNPQPVDGEQIENIRRALASRQPTAPCPYVPGDEIVIDRGPLTGVKGIVQRTKQGTRVIVRVEMLHRAISVEVAASDVLKATP